MIPLFNCLNVPSYFFKAVFDGIVFYSLPYIYKECLIDSSTMCFWDYGVLGIRNVGNLDEGDEMFERKVVTVLSTINISTTSDDLLKVLAIKVSQLPDNCLKWNLINRISENFRNPGKLNSWKTFLKILKKRTIVVDTVLYVQILQQLSNFKYSMVNYDDEDYNTILGFLVENPKKFRLYSEILTQILSSFSFIVVINWTLFIGMLHKVETSDLRLLFQQLSLPSSSQLTLTILIEISHQLSCDSPDELWEYFFKLLKQYTRDSENQINLRSEPLTQEQIDVAIRYMYHVCLESTETYRILSAVELLVTLRKYDRHGQIVPSFPEVIKDKLKDTIVKSDDSVMSLKNFDKLILWAS